PISYPHFASIIPIYFQWFKLKPSARLQLGFPLRLLLGAAAARGGTSCLEAGIEPADRLISVQPIRKLNFWRRRKDSNPLYAFGAYNGAAIRCRPLRPISFRIFASEKYGVTRHRNSIS